MKILCYSDIHWSSYSSILTMRGNKYSIRLEHLINTVSWAEWLSQQYKCDMVCCLGDFFDRSELNSEEITALKDITWNYDIPHKFIVGNHEMGRSNLDFSSSHLFKLLPFVDVINEYTTEVYNNLEIDYIPYILRTNMKSFSEYKPSNPNLERIVFSHNDLKGIQMGKFISVDGFDVGEITDNCSLFVNGHLHNGQQITSRVFNIGNTCGQNFSEDAEKYGHEAWIIDTDTLNISRFENPFAFNFYKISDKNKLNNLKPNAVISLVLDQDDDIPSFKEYLNSISIANSLVISNKSKLNKDIKDEKDNINDIRLTDHLKKFEEFILNNLGDSDIIKSELKEVIE